MSAAVAADSKRLVVGRKAATLAILTHSRVKV